MKIKTSSIFLIILPLFNSIDQARAIPPVKGLLNVHEIAFGQSLLSTKFIQNIWTYGDKKDPLTKIVKTLFHRIKFGEALGNITPSNVAPAIYLTKKHFAELINFINNGTIFDKSTIKKWISTLKDSITNDNTFRETRTKEFVTKLKKALKNQKSQFYPPTTVESILWIFFCQKWNDESLIREVIEKTKYKKTPIEWGKYHDNNEILKLKNTVNFETFEAEISNKYDLLLSAELFLNSITVTPPQMMIQSNVQYKYESDKYFERKCMTCVETSILNFVNILRFNAITKKFDPSLILQKGEGLEEIKKIIQTPMEASLATKIKPWFQAISNRKNLDYNVTKTFNEQEHRYNVLGSLKNFINIFNYIFGTNLSNSEKSIEKMGKFFTTKTRSVNFTLDKKNTLTTISVDIAYPNKQIEYKFAILIESTKKHMEILYKNIGKKSTNTIFGNYTKNGIFKEFYPFMNQMAPKKEVLFFAEITAQIIHKLFTNFNKGKQESVKKILPFAALVNSKYFLLFFPFIKSKFSYLSCNLFYIFYATINLDDDKNRFLVFDHYVTFLMEKNPPTYLETFVNNLLASIGIDSYSAAIASQKILSKKLHHKHKIYNDFLKKNKNAALYILSKTLDISDKKTTLDHAKLLINFPGKNILIIDANKETIIEHALKYGFKNTALFIIKNVQLTDIKHMQNLVRNVLDENIYIHLNDKDRTSIFKALKENLKKALIEENHAKNKSNINIIQNLVEQLTTSINEIEKDL